MTIAISDTIKIPKGTYGVNLNFTVYNNDETAHNLSGLTITFKAWKEGKPNSTIVSDSCDIDVAASGTCHYEIKEDDFKTVGKYLWELELTKADYQDNTLTGQLIITESG